MEYCENEFSGCFSIRATSEKNEWGERLYQVWDENGTDLLDDEGQNPNQRMVENLIKNVKYEDAGGKIILKGKKAKEVFGWML